jgi:hypothetical protein
MEPDAHDRGAETVVLDLAGLAIVEIYKCFAVGGTEDHQAIASLYAGNYSVQVIGPDTKGRLIAQVQVPHFVEGGIDYSFCRNGAAGLEVDSVGFGWGPFGADHPKCRVVYFDPPDPALAVSKGMNPRGGRLDLRRKGARFVGVSG